MLPKIRTITGFITTSDLHKINTLLDNLLLLKDHLQKQNYTIQTIRITTDIVEKIDLGKLAIQQKILQQLENNPDVSLYHLGGLEKINKDIEKELTAFFLEYKKSFLSININKPENINNCLHAARMCRKISDFDSFATLRFAACANVINSTPFYPASRVFNNSMRFAIGLQCANLAVEESKQSNKNQAIFAQKLRSRMEYEFAKIEQIIPAELTPFFLGFDTSLAPYPNIDESIANAIEIVSGKPFGSSGTLTICELLTNVMKHNQINKTGLCGLMLPIVEDNVLARRGIEGRYTLKELLLYSSVCATGIDTAPISGQVSSQDLVACYNDLATLAMKLQKPLSARFFIVPDKRPGQTITYDWEFACESPIFGV